MRIGYLGPLEVASDGRPVAVPGVRLRRLLLRLTVDAGAWVSGDALTAAVWPEGGTADPANALQSLVSRLRRTLGDPALVQQSPAGYRLAVDPEDVDAVRFTRLVTAAGIEPDGATALTALDAALALWRGRPLQEDDSPDATGPRTALEELHLGARRERAARLVAAGRAAEALPVLEQLTAEHPLREDLAAVLLDALAAAGRPADGLAAYERLRAALADGLGTDPSAQVRERHLALLRLDEEPARPGSNLRAAVTSFVGRDDDVRAVRERLAAGRLVTVVGAGGAGKTRLAGEVATQVLADSARPAVPDGVWLIELAPVSDPAAVPQAVLDALGVREVALPDQHTDRHRGDARARLVAHLRDARCLLVVDNCEHVVDAAADLVADLLGRCPGVRVLATSREPLGVDGETLHPLGPLAVPAEGASAAEAAASPAVRLLLDRARAVSADVTVDDAVVEVVRRLDGLPLAVELAAARLRVLTPAELADRLADRFRLLTGGRRTATPRHRTLRAVVEWSWELLGAREREVAEHFSVFASGATEDAVAAVCPSWRAGAGRDELADVLAALVDKSLLTTLHTSGGTRFRMLETLREYGAERLAEDGRAAAARDAHARRYAALVARCDPVLRGPAQLEALRVLDTEHDDVLLALRHLVDTGDAAAALELVVDLSWYWTLRENERESVRWTSAVLALPGAADSPLAPFADAMRGMMTSYADSDGRPGREPARLRLLSDRLAPVEALRPALTVLRPLLLMMAGAPEDAAPLLERALAAEDPWVRASARLIRMAFAQNDADLASLRAEAATGLAEWEELGDRWGIGALLSGRGQVRTLDGDLTGAAEDYERAQQLVRELGGTSDHLLVTMRLADLRLRAGDVEGARRHLATMRAARSLGTVEVLRSVLVAATAGSVAVAAGDVDGVRAGYGALVAVLAGLSVPAPHSEHIGAVGHAAAGLLALHLGDLPAAGGHVRAGHRLAVGTQDRPILASVGLTAAGWAHAVGAAREAAVLLGAAERLRGAADPTNPVLARLTAALRDDLGDEFDTAHAEGMALDPEAAATRLDPDRIAAGFEV
ncbi:BTAD domain-containing putative transcriptional regulator [Geodermatophilus sp. URMC 62]|uniref:BTAD domain-containing putative transcriptional regulator n=1 Tax=Geodermatophilus sp. URMC 62 TaxID=3423414 RepID=UPI00406CC616